MKNKLGFITVVLIFLMYSFALNKERTKTKELTYKVTTQESTIDSLETVLNTYELENERLVNVEYDYVLKSSNLVHLFTTISKIESSEGLFVVGDGGNAFGPLQIHKGCVNDVNNRYNTDYTHTDMFDMEKAMDVAAMYLNINAERYNNYYNHYPTIEQLARSWNGGFGGFTNDLTLEYGNKFTNYLNDV